MKLKDMSKPIFLYHQNDPDGLAVGQRYLGTGDLKIEILKISEKAIWIKIIKPIGSYNSVIHRDNLKRYYKQIEPE